MHRTCYCGRLAVAGARRCAQHTRPKRTGSYSRDAAKVRAAATVCHICGKPFDDPRDPRDPPVADHVRPRLLGGSDDPANLAPAHRSCNGRKGAQLAPYAAL